MLKVLLVDTEPYIRDTLRRKFELEGFEVMTVESQQAGELFLEVKPDLIVLGKAADFQHGSLLTSLTARIPVIVISNSSDHSSILQHEVARLTMPFRPSDLMAVAKEAVAGLAV